MVLVQRLEGGSQLATMRDLAPTPFMSSPTAVAKPSLSKRVGSAVLWIGLGLAASQLIRLASNVVLARLLSPEMYGLQAMGAVVIAAVVMLSDFGFSQSVVYSPRGDDPAFLDTIWTMQLIRAGVLCLLMNLAAAALWALGQMHPDWLGGSYADPLLPAVIAVLSLVPVAMGIESTNLARAHRALSMGQVVRNEVLVQVAVTVVLILLALRWPSFWLLPAGWVASAMGIALLSHVNLPGPRNRLHWEREAAHAAWHFSKWILLSSGLTYLFREGDRILLGGMLSPAEMGVYAVGALLVTATRDGILRLAGLVGMPALAEIAREQPQRLRSAYHRCRWPIDIVCLLAAGGLFAAAHRIVDLLYDLRYAAAGTVLQVLSLGLIAHRYTVTDQYLIATGETRQLFKRGAIQTLVLYLAVPAGFWLGGLQGALVGIVAAQWAVIPLMIQFQHQRGLLDWRFEIGTLVLLPVGWCLGWLVT